MKPQHSDSGSTSSTRVQVPVQKRKTSYKGKGCTSRVLQPNDPIFEEGWILSSHPGFVESIRTSKDGDSGKASPREGGFTS